MSETKPRWYDDKLDKGDDNTGGEERNHDLGRSGWVLLMQWFEWRFGLKGPINTYWLPFTINKILWIGPFQFCHVTYRGAWKEAKNRKQK